MAEIKSTKKDNPMLDPVAYRSDYPEEAIIGDTPATVEVTEKYTGEGTNNVYHPYNRTLTIDQLDPNYKYGQPAKDINAIDDSYITRRNDQIASALYNEGKVTYDEVVGFLESQPNWFNSNEKDRENTKANVWNRIGQISSENDKKDTKDTKDEEKKSQWTGEEIYGKNTADEGKPSNGIEAGTDANAVLNQMESYRRDNLDSLLRMPIESIAAALNSGSLPSDMQAVRDYQLLYPQLWSQVQDYQKKLSGQEAINSITKGETDYVEKDVETKEKLTESTIENMADSVSSTKEESESIKETITSDISNNPVVTSAEETMEKTKSEMNKLKKRLQNLKKEATNLFSGDTPQYIVNAYITNRTQEINDKLQDLKYDYDAAYERSQNEINNYWKGLSYSIQERNQKLQEDKFEYEKQKVANQSTEIKWEGGTPYQIQYTDDGVIVSKVQIVEQYTNSGMKGKGLKNNNPGNIKDTQFGNSIGTDSSGFAIFATPEDGFDALVEKIKYNQTNPNSKYYGTTLREYFRIYAPSSDGNNPDAYAQSVAKQLGVSVDTPIKDIDATKLAAVIAKHDSGYDYSTYGKFRGGTRNNNKTINPDDIEIPNDIYIKDTGFSLERVDPNSEEGQKLKQQYIDNYIKENGLSMASDGELVARDDLGGQSGTAYQVISDDNVTPISFRQRIYNLVPATLKNSDTELKNLYRIAKDLYEAGYSADEASMVFYGLDPRNDKTGLLKPLVYLASASGKKLGEEFYGNLGRLLEAGNTKQAVRLLENTVMDDEQQKKESDTISLISKIQDLEQLIQDAEPITGPYKGTLEDFFTKYVGSDSKYADIAANMQNIYGYIQNDLLGSNQTEGEMKRYSGMIPQPTDYMSVIKSKLKSTKENALKDINAVRDLYDLPHLDEDTLTNLSARAYLYGGIDTSDTNRGN